MSRGVQLILLCEDRQHETFVRRYLAETGWSTRKLRVEIAPRGGGSAEHYVRGRFPDELIEYRRHRHRVARALLVMIDGDNIGVGGRLEQLADACRARGVEPRRQDDNVAVFVPTWNIETWLAYLDGRTVDETSADYPRLERERECQRHVDELRRMCLTDSLRDPSPPSLEAACDEYRERLNMIQA